MVQSLDRGLEILLILKQKNYASITELAVCLKVNKSTASRLVETLRKHDLVQMDAVTKKYRLGFKILQLAEGLKDNLNIISVARIFLSKLCDQLNESVHLCAYSNRMTYVVDQVRSKKIYNLSADIGMIEPMHSSAVGKCILAFKSQSYIDNFLKDYELTSYTPKTVTNIDELKQRLSIIKSQGYAVDNEEMALGVICIAAPIFNYRGSVQYSIGVSGPTVSIKPSNIDLYIKKIVSTGKQISAEMGYTN